MGELRGHYRDRLKHPNDVVLDYAMRWHTEENEPKTLWAVEAHFRDGSIDRYGCLGRGDARRMLIAYRRSCVLFWVDHVKVRDFDGTYTYPRINDRRMAVVE